jgi:hypothetical protein
MPKIVSADSIHWESEARAEGTWFRREFKVFASDRIAGDENLPLGPHLPVRRRSLALFKDEDQVNLPQTLMIEARLGTNAPIATGSQKATTIKLQLCFMLALDGIQHGVPPIMTFLHPNRKSYQRLISHPPLKAFVQWMIIGD